MPKLSRQDVYRAVPMIKLARPRMAETAYLAYVGEWWSMFAASNPAFVDKERFVALCYGLRNENERRWVHLSKDRN